MSKKIVALASLFVALTASGHAFAGPNGGGKGPCEQIETDCKNNGYVVGEAKEGKGFWMDCMCPLIASGFPEPSKNVLKVPSDQGLVAACQKHPHGQRIMNNCAKMQAKKNGGASHK